MKIKRNILTVVQNTRPFYYLAGFMLFCFLHACKNDVAEVNSITAANEKEKPIETSINIEFLYSDSARVRSRLKAPLVEHYLGKKPYYEMKKGMDVVFYNQLGKEENKLTANYGIGYDNEIGPNQAAAGNQSKMSIMEAKGNVVVVNEKGDKLNTEHLTWNSITKKIYTDEFVKITTKDEVIWGDGLEANEDFSEYEIKHVKGNIAVKDEAIKQ
ncbi:MAG: LPS export ABC transporter periplasmic protein LptC [Bacteroidota bacterium]